MSVVQDGPHLVTCYGAARPGAPGLDIIVVHGVKTVAAQDLPSNWARILSQVAPQNSAVFSFDVNITADEGFIWQTFAQRAAALLDAIIQRYHGNADRHSRAPLFIGYTLSGLVIKRTLNALSQRVDYERYIHKTAGLIFLATPHLKDASPWTRQRFAGILRHVELKTGKVQTLIKEASLEDLATCCRRFTELNLQCRILSCWEQFEVKTPRPFSRRVQRVDEQFAETSASRHERLAQIDCKLSTLLGGDKSILLDMIRDFMEATLDDIENGEDSMPETLIQNDWVEIAGSVPVDQSSFLDSQSRIADHMANPDPTGSHRVVSSPGIINGVRQSENSLPETRPVRRCMPREQPTVTLSSVLLSGKNSPRQISSSSEESYEVVLSSSDAQVPEHLVYVQNLFFETPNADFQGRGKTLARMDEILLPSPTTTMNTKNLPRTYILCGPGGIGKTQTALHYFHSHQDKFDVALWVQANSFETLDQAFRDIAFKLNLQTLKDYQKSNPTPKMVIDWLRNPKQETWKTNSRIMKWLIVFDNLDEDKIVTNYWPSGAPGSIIVTTRDPLVKEEKASSIQDVDLGPLKVHQALSLLRGRLPKQLCSEESDETLSQVVKVLGYWPLAIVQMAGKMRRLKQTPTKFLLNYGKEHERYRYHRSLELHQDGYNLSFTSIWSLDDLDPHVAALLSVISLLSPDAIPEFVLEDEGENAALSKYPSGSDYVWTISELEKSSTVNRATSARLSQITIHSLIQEVVRSQLLEHEARFVEAFKTVVRLLMAKWPHETKPTTYWCEYAKVSRWEQCNLLLPHLSHVRKMFQLLHERLQTSAISEEFFYLLSEVSWHHYLKQNFDEALEYAQLTLTTLNLVPGRYPQIRASQYGTWASIAKERNQPRLAREKMAQSFDINQDIYKEQQIITSSYAASYAEFGRVLIMNDLEEAERLLIESIELRKAMPKFTRLQLYTPIVALSYIDLTREHLEEAEARLREALAVREEFYGFDDRESVRTGLLFAAIGNILLHAQRYEDAKSYYALAFDQLCDTGGNSCVEVGHVCYKLALIHRESEDFVAALGSIDRAVTIYDHYQYFTAEHSRALFIRAQILKRLGDESRVENDFAESIRLREKFLNTKVVNEENLSIKDFDKLIQIEVR